MNVVFGWRTRYERLDGGREVRARCPECEREADLYECVAKRNFNLFLVLDVLDTESRVFVCSACGAAIDPDELTVLTEGARDATHVARPVRPAVDDREIDRELAAMKKKLRKR